MEDDATEGALDQCFDAIFAPEHWPAAMDALSASLGAFGACFNPHGASADRIRLPASPRYRDMLSEFVSGGWSAQDLRARRGWRLSLGGQNLVFEDDVTSPQERSSLPLYREFFARHELDVFVGLRLNVDGQSWSFNLARPARMGGFEPQAEQLLHVQPALRRVLRTAGQLSQLSGRSAVAAFTHVGCAAMLLDGTGRILQANPQAERLMGDGLDIHHQRLAAHIPAADKALQALIGAALRGDRADAVCIARADKPPLVVEAVAMRNLRAEIFGFHGVMLLITDPQNRPAPKLEILRDAFGLTPREAKVARLLASGLDAGEIAEILNLRRSTVQQIVKAVLSKTDTGRQGALVALLARMPGEDETISP